MEKKREYIFWENLIMAAILLVLVQTFLADLAVIADWPWVFRRALIITAFLFDFIFTLEFLIRFFSALYRGEGEVKKYIVNRQGWVDLIVSVPLLLFSSTPELFSLLSGVALGGFGGVLNILKVVKSVRVARLLRLLRILKIFSHIKFADSPMAQRHTSRIVTTVVTSLIFSLTLMSFLVSFVSLNDLNRDFDKDHRQTVLYLIEEDLLVKGGESLASYSRDQTDLLMIKRGDEDLFSRYQQDVYADYYGFSDYAVMSSGDYHFYFDVKPVNVSQAWYSLVVFIEILLVIAVIMVTYSTHFAINVTDPINIMYKGLNEEEYNLEVAIPPPYQNDDIFRLARSYNDEYLPLKARSIDDAGRDEDSKLDLSDLDDLFKL